MSARVLNPVMMSELGHRGGMVGSTRVAPSRVALARVRRDLFGPVDHSAARALAERELRAQSLLDAERWGFDFHLEIPRKNSRYEWEPITDEDVIPEPYALRGMPYLRKNSPGTSRKNEETTTGETLPQSSSSSSSSTSSSSSSTRIKRSIVVVTTTTPVSIARKAERTPPQEPRVPEISETGILSDEPENFEEDTTAVITCRRKKVKCIVTHEPTTPVLKTTTRKQSSITDFMKSRKRTLNGSTKSIVELPEKIARNAGQIRS
ncbi:uncharacterized protein [Venturia canescens]|uniref:uncharacterized protein n=1 Tax=Venturia canescens TaxID=32260 RepID=UPI001C9D2F76|nr:uncharacterized protein LOC122408211 [Venturia canescens]